MAEALVRELIRRGDSKVALFGNNDVEVIQTLADVAKNLPYQCNCHNI